MADSPVDVHVNETSVPAQVTGAPREEEKESSVHETYVTTDVVITDANHELAVQIPDAGRGDSITPTASAFAKNPKTVEEIFKAEAAKSKK